MRLHTAICIAALGSGVLAASATALPASGQPGGMRDPRGPATLASTASSCAARNFVDGTPGEAIIGGLFNAYGIPGFFPYGTGEPGSGTGGWVSAGCP